MNGVINVYKEAGFTSHDVVAKLRGIVKQKKIGHTGTLDPDAEGVLPVCLGNATKLCGLLSDKEKTYRAVLLLGRVTDTQDVSGQTLRTALVEVTEEAVRQAILSFLGDYDQVPPMYSALKVGGKKLYELAREGKEVERKARRVRILEITIHEISLPEVSFTVTCTSGTYIRTLCQDIGDKLGCGGCMKSLLRTKVDRFLLEDALRLSELSKFMEEGRIEEALLSVDEMFPECPKLRMKPGSDRLVRNGNPFSDTDAEEMDGCGREIESEIDNGAGSETAEDLCALQSGLGGPREGQVRVYDSAGCFVGLYQRKVLPETAGRDGAKWEYRPVKMFLS